MQSELTFIEEHSGETSGLTPYVDGVSLIDLLTAYEVTQGYEGSNNYVGNAPWITTNGEVDAQFFTVEEAGGSANHVGVRVFGCNCGVSECWPLYVNVSVEQDLVVWKSFSHGTRPSRDYRGFGPFRFDRLQYNEAVKAAMNW